MKQLLSTLFLFAFLNVNAQEANFCTLFIDGYNSASLGFPSLRSANTINTDTLQKFNINEDFMKLYKFKNGSILNKAPFTSGLYRDKTYSKWTLFLKNEIILLNDKKWDDVKEPIIKDFSSIAQKLAGQCLVDLQMSELVLPSDNFDFDLAAYYFYPKQISIPKNASNDLIKELLKERNYIVISIKKPVFSNGFYMSYSIQGVKYN